MPYLEPYKEAKKAQNLTNNDIAVRSGTPLTTVTKFFNEGSKNPSAITMSNISRVLGVSMDEVFGLKQPENKLDPNTEAIINSYTEIIKEKDAHIKEQSERILEQNETIKQMRIDKVKKQKKDILLLVLFVLFIAPMVFLLLFDLMNGHFGYFRY